MTTITTLYGVVVKWSNGRENMNSFLIKDSAINEAKKLISMIKSSNKKGLKGLRVYLSELQYDEYKNKILSDSLINNDSKLLFEK